ncbi:hypothetical protein [Anaerolentibacter hominis]|uniref:hypothetical protein n=1 Tax=Anaerolentibacter hominis TaxID=3079009 RepID=UPI0031B86260
MKIEELYRSTFSQLHTSVTADMEELQMKKRHRVSKKPFIVAAAICLMLACTTTAYAMNLFGLRDFLMPKPEPLSSTEQDTGGQDSDEKVTSSDKAPDVLSMQGYTNSPESLAAAEWLDFQNNYDPDGSILAGIGNGPTGLDERYGLYSVYTQEMADKLDEITEKYNLKLHTELLDISNEDLTTLAGGDFLGKDNQAYSSYMYEDGTFHYDGEADIDGMLITYQFTRCVRGSFTDILYYPGDISEYKDRSYTTSSGVAVTLALGPAYSLILADLGDSIVTVNIFAGYGVESDRLITGTILELFADSFDWTILKNE